MNLKLAFRNGAMAAIKQYKIANATLGYPEQGLMSTPGAMKLPAQAGVAGGALAQSLKPGGGMSGSVGGSMGSKIPNPPSIGGMK